VSLVERPEVLSQKGLLLHNAFAIPMPSPEIILHRTNISGKTVNLPKICATGLAETYAGPTCEITENYQPADVRADPHCVAGPEKDHPPKEAPSVPVEAQAPRTNGPLQDGVPLDQEPPEPSPSPRVAYELIPADLHPAVHRMMDRYPAVWSGRLGQIDVTPCRIALHPGARPIRPQPYRTVEHGSENSNGRVLTRLSIGTQFWVFTYARAVCFVLLCT